MKQNSMQAFVLACDGAQDVEFAEVSVPQIDADELLIRVQAVGVGVHDSYFLPDDAHYPYPIGIEAAGVIEEVGAAVSGRRPGDRIAFVSSMQPKGGTWAEFVAVKADSLIVAIPADMDFPESAAIPVAGNTALRAFHALDSPPAGGSLFIAGGSGAIGTLAVQMARRRGWRVAASASTSNHDYLRSLGAEQAVDYHDLDWQARILEWMPTGVDAAMAIQPGTSADSLPVVRDGGKLISISGDEIVSERGIRMGGIPYEIDVQSDLARLLGSIVTGDTHVEIEHVYPFDMALDALAKVQTRRARGKSVLSLQQSGPHHPRVRHPGSSLREERRLT